MFKLIAFAVKFAGAAIAALIFVAGLNLYTDLLYSPLGQAVPEAVPQAMPTEPAAPVPAKTDAAPAAPAPAVEPPTLGGRLQAASADKGRKVFKKCQACHTYEEGDKNKVGPNLYNIVGRDIAADAEFKYSDAMRAHAGTKNSWSFENLQTYLTNPKAAVPGNKMAFVGIKKPKQMADLLVFLRGLSASPVELP